MAIVIRRLKKTPPPPPEEDALSPEVVGAVVMLGYCAVIVDGEVSDEEVDGLTKIVSSGLAQLSGAEVSDEDVATVLRACGDKLEAVGFDGMVDHAVDILSRNESWKALALRFTGLVIMSDGDFDLEGDEAQFYDGLAVKLGIDEEASAAIWNELVDALALTRPGGRPCARPEPWRQGP